MPRARTASAIWRAYKRGAALANPCYTQIHPTCIPVSGDYQSKLTLMSESLRNDGRIWVPKKAGDKRSPDQIPEAERDYYLERRYPSFGNLVPRDGGLPQRQIPSATPGRRESAKPVSAFTSISATPSSVSAVRVSKSATVTCLRCTSASPARTPTKSPCAFTPAIHYTMGGLLGRLPVDEHHPRPCS